MEFKNIVVVGGAGHVGLPLALSFADKGFSVVALDVNETAISKIIAGYVPFVEEGIEQVLKRCLGNGSLTLTSNVECLREADVIFIVIGTPVDEFLNPNPNYVLDLCRSFLGLMRDNQLIVLRSTLFPGVTKRIEKLIADENLAVDVVYCPERILQGKALREISELPQIIGARNDLVAKRAIDLFSHINLQLQVSTPEEAELAKLFTNAWRYMKFAISNQFWMMSNELGVDYQNVIDVITKDYPRASDLPSPGFTAGPCLFKDTMQLAATLPNNFPLGHAAMMINEGLPSYLVHLLKCKFDLGGLNVGILGAAFKADVDDTRGSLSFKLRRILQFECKKVLMCDPFVQDSRLTEIEKVVEESDVLILATPHLVYKHLRLEKPVVDVWNFYGKGLLIQ